MKQYSGIGVLDKAMLILQIITKKPCSLTELSEQTSMPRATAHRIAVGLETHQLLTRNQQGRWCLGGEVQRLASRVQDPLLAASAHVLPRLREITGESIQLYRRDGTERVCIASLEPHSGLRDTVPVGARLTMTAGSAAKILVAWAGSPTQQQVLQNACFHERTLQTVRTRGWAQSIAEREPGVSSVSVAVRDTMGTVIAALSVSGPVNRMNRLSSTKWAAELQGAAEAIRNRL